MWHLHNVLPTQKTFHNTKTECGLTPNVNAFFVTATNILVSIKIIIMVIFSFHTAIKRIIYGRIRIDN